MAVADSSATDGSAATEGSVDGLGPDIGLTDKMAVIAKYRVNDKDTGSPEVQVALLTQRLARLARHFENNKLDKHSRRGLLKIVSKRKRLLGYLKKENITRYRTLIAELGLRK